MSHDPNTNVRYPLTWPFWLAEKAAEAASERAMSVAAWLREAALEKLERQEGRKTLPPGYRSYVDHLDGDPYNNDPDNLRIVKGNDRR